MIVVPLKISNRSGGGLVGVTIAGEDCDCGTRAELWEMATLCGGRC